jgi:Helix-turn-helix domain
MGELRDALKELKDRRGMSYADLTKAAEAAGDDLARSTLSDLFGKRCTISEPKLRILLRALGVPDGDTAPWVDALRRTQGSGRPAGVRGFFSHLIADHTALFAGRDEELKRILEFVDRCEKGYVFVEALSGYGKTSLLANLVDRNRQFRYHFISQAYRRPGGGFDSTRRTDVLDSLCEQLNPAHVRGGDARSLEEEFISLMSNPYPTKTVVVLDGIDELGHGDKLDGLMQKRPPQGLVIVLSARTKGNDTNNTYLPDVGLSLSDIGLRVTLPGLDMPAIVSLMQEAGGAAVALARDQRFVQGLHAVSGGDPFYLRFLVEDVASGTLTAANIDQAPSGLEGYLDLQFKILRRSGHRPEHKQIFCLLLEAGALSGADLIPLVPGLDAFNFYDVLDEIHRFLLVDDGHYRLCHDRFRAYFRAKAGLD